MNPHWIVWLALCETLKLHATGERMVMINKPEFASPAYAKKLGWRYR